MFYERIHYIGTHCSSVYRLEYLECKEKNPKNSGIKIMVKNKKQQHSSKSHVSYKKKHVSETMIQG